MYISKCNDPYWRLPQKMSKLMVVLKESVLLRSSSTPLHAPVADTFY
jgi:hypothetical protein